RQLLAALALDAAELDALVARLAGPGEPAGTAAPLARTAAGRLLSQEALHDVVERMAAALADFHAREPLARGLARGALAGALPGRVPADAVDLALARMAAAGRIGIGPEGFCLASRPGGATLADAERSLAERVLGGARAAGLEPPTLKEWSDRLGQPAERLRPLLAHLEREGALVRAPGELWFDRAAVDALRARVVAHLRAGGGLETRAYKALIGTTRKHAVPLMELFDAERTTLRVGNRRILRRPA
ncbi:MAG TPA: SelB C-terminal domain-containing protein, partial [Myxococcota bacterium]|nr:SelB C-terminal domain-containing protein [Myxococcota bacterium]